MLSLIFMALVTTLPFTLGMQFNDESARAAEASRRSALLSSLCFFVEAWELWSASNPEPPQGELPLAPIFTVAPGFKLRDSEGWRLFQMGSRSLLITTLFWEPGLRESLEAQGGRPVRLESHGLILQTLPLIYWNGGGLKSAWTGQPLESSTLPAGVTMEEFQLGLLFDPDEEVFG